MTSRPTVVELFAQRAERTASLVAVAHGPRTRTYAELAADVDAWAAYLRQRGVGPESLVGLYLDRSIEAVTAALAVLRAGGAYVPLDPSLPAERVRLMLSDCAPTLVLTRSALMEQAQLGGVAACALDVARSLIVSTDNPGRFPRPDELAYVLYTSGSTGRPKGVQIEHRSLSNYVHWAAREYGVRPGGVVPLHSSLGFDFTVTSLLVPLVAGARIEILDDYRSAFTTDDGAYTLVKFTPSHLAAGRSGRENGSSAAPAPLMVIGGEALRADALAPWQDAAGDTVVVNEYGPTEATVGCCVHRRRVRDLVPGPVPIGTPISGMSVHLLDDELRPVPDGTAGEVYIGGIGVARGYCNRAALTAQRFLPDPFSDVPGARMYRSGDRARRLPDGELDYLGRLDDQVKIMGYRVEPGEIETAIVGHPDVAAAAVAVRNDAAGDRRLVAYLVGEPGRPKPGPATLLPHLQRLLPEYMLPLTFTVLDCLPLTSNGKLDRRSLPGALAGPPVGPSPDASSNTTELGPLARIWAEVLEIVTVQADDNFLALGGNSLAAARVLARLHAELGLTVSLRDFFERPTLREFAAAVVPLDAKPRLPPILPTADSGPAPLSFAQQRLWFLEQLAPGSADYHVPIALRLRGVLREDALRTALDALFHRHRALRTALPAVDGKPHQIVLDLRCPLEVTCVPVDGSDEQHLRVLATEEVERPFDLERGPLMRARLLRVSAEDHVLVLTVHHVATDVRSTAILRAELAVQYAAAIDGVDPGLVESAVQYLDFARWQRRIAQEPQVREQLDYWRVQLKDLGLVDLDPGRARARQQATVGRSVSFVVNEALSAAVSVLATRLGATTSQVALAAYAAVLARHTGSDDLVIGSPVLIRPSTEVEHVVGCFLNMVTLRISAADAPNFAELVHRARDTMIQALDHTDLPFEAVVEDLCTERDTGRTPLFQVAFSHQLGAGSDASAFGPASAEPFPIIRRRSRFDLTLAVHETPSSLRADWEYRPDLLDGSTIAALHADFVTVLRAAVDTPDWVPWPGPSAESVQWGPPQSIPAMRVDELVEAQVARTPDRTAIVAGPRSLTYADLNAAADQLARRLAAAGAGPGAPVGVYVRRDADLVISLLAVWKSGAPYVPLDPAQPPVRLARMVHAAGVAVVLTQRTLDATTVAGAASVLHVDEPESCTGTWPKPAHRPGHQGDRAYVIFTSGSTGTPKGVAIDHRAVVNLLTWFAGATALDRHESFVSVTTPAFDIAVLELFLPLTRGARLVLADAEVAGDPTSLRELIERAGPCIVQATPTTWRMLADVGAVPANVRVRLCGGEALAPDLAQRLRTPGTELWNVYGPTETTVWSCAGPIGADPQQIGIGAPIGNTAISIRDADLALVPVGTVGEICISGAGVAQGYIGAPSLTAQRFVPDPTSRVGADPTGGGPGGPGARMYRTGDQGRVRPDGTLEFLGRHDQQVKIRGHRVEPGEIEAALLEHPQVQAAAVIVDTQAADGPAPAAPRLVAYVIARDPRTPPDTVTLRGHLSRRLPSYLVPAAFVGMTQFPLTANGKLDRKTLADTAVPGLVAAGGHVLPRNSLEDAFARIWADVLGAGEIGVHDDFFALGGDSILAIQVVAQARDTGLWITPAQLFDLPTVAELAEAAASAVPDVASSDDRRDGEAAAPDGNRRTRVILDIDLPAGTSEASVDNAVFALRRRHDLLRARWAEHDAMLIIEHEDGELPELQHSVIVAGDGTVRVRLQLPAVLFSRASLAILAVDLRRACARAHATITPTWPTVTTSYRRWSTRIARYADSVVAAAELDYWDKMRSGPPAVCADRSAAPGTAHGPQVAALNDDIDIDINTDTDIDTDTDLWAAASRWYGATGHELLVAALVLATTECADDEVRLSIDDQRHHSPFPELDLVHSVGPFGYRYPVQLRRSGLDASGVVRAVRDQLRLIPREGLPYSAVRRFSADATRRADLHRDGFADLLVRLAPPLPDGSTVADDVEAPRGIALAAEAVGTRLRVVWTVRTDRYSRSTIDALRERFVEAIHELCGAPRAGRIAPSRFPMARMTPQQLDRVGADAGIEDIYPLTPAQSGMMFHTLLSPAHGMYLNQASFTLDGPFDPELFHDAMAVVADRHPALRAAILGPGLAEPHQIVRRDVAPPLRQVGRDNTASDIDLAGLLASEREADFDFGRAPLYRALVVRKDPTRHLLVWTAQHAVLDGWSTSLVFSEWWDAYAALATGRTPPEVCAPPYRDYVSWIEGQHATEVANYWRSRLQGARPTLIATSSNATGTAADVEAGARTSERIADGRFDARLTAQLAMLAARTRSSIAALICAAWAQVLSQVSGEPDVMFGVAQSGRSAPLPGLDAMVGLLANTLPLRVRVPRFVDPLEYVAGVQGLLAQVRRREFSALPLLNDYAGLARGHPLFDSTVGVQNFPFFRGGRHEGAPLVRRGPSFSRNSYAVTVSVFPGAELVLRLRSDRARVSHERAQTLADALRAAVVSLVADL